MDISNGPIGLMFCSEDLEVRTFRATYAIFEIPILRYPKGTLRISKGKQIFLILFQFLVWNNHFDELEKHTIRLQKASFHEEIIKKQVML